MRNFIYQFGGTPNLTDKTPSILCVNRLGVGGRQGYKPTSCLKNHENITPFSTETRYYV